MEKTEEEPQEIEHTSIRISKPFLLRLEAEKVRLQTEGKSKMSNEEFIEYLLVKHKIFEGELTESDIDELKLKIAKDLELTHADTNGYKMASYINMRSALFDVMGPPFIAHFNVDEYADKKGNIDNDKVMKGLNKKFDKVLKNNNVEHIFLLEQ